MQLNSFAKGAAAAVLADQVTAKTGFAFKVGGVIAVVSLLGVVLVDGWVRWLIVLALVLGLGILLFVFLTKRIAMSLVNRIAPPANLSLARGKIEAAVAEADIPTGPIGFLKLIWRLRKGIGPEIERLGAVVSRFESELD